MQRSSSAGLRRTATAAATIGWLSLAGCDAAVQRHDAVQAVADAGVAYASQWTAGIIEQPRPNAPAAILLSVRNAAHDGFDRLVFEFDGHVPGYHIEYIDKPVRKCGSGDVTQIAGDGWLEVRMFAANAHSDAGSPTIAERERMLNLPLIAELEMTCDFEAVVTWVAGVTSPNPYRVQELNDPPRLVVDIATRRTMPAPPAAQE